MNPSDPAFYKELLDHMSDGVYFVDRDRKILYWNEGAFRLSGYNSTELLGRSCQDDILCHVDYEGRNLCHSGCPLSASIQDGTGREANVFLRHKGGHRVPVTVRVQPLVGEGGDIVGAIEIFSDDSAQTEARRKAEAMKRLAFLDHLTEIPNRRFLEMSLGTALAEYHVHHDCFGVLVFDMDKLKSINDSFGHATGDRALQLVAKTVVGSLRPDDVIGRWGGDEFLAIIRNADQAILTSLAERCVTMVSRDRLLGPDGETISLSISAGATLVGPSETVQELIDRADALMYQSKTSGGGRAATE
jgi:diguanylate cyclase (GGDEF)-like protein/PAS domain S-box-containing protein